MEFGLNMYKKHNQIGQTRGQVPLQGGREVRIRLEKNCARSAKDDLIHLQIPLDGFRTTYTIRIWDRMSMQT